MDYPIGTEYDIPFELETVLTGYRHGIFPMGDQDDDTIYWFCPDPRAIIPLDGFHASRSLQRSFRRGEFEVTYDRAFREVMIGCAEGRPVWITDRIFDMYTKMHELGAAHSVEVWQNRRLVGGTYGVQIGGAFMAESKFHRVTDASKIALWKLVERLGQADFEILEVQYLTDHLRQFGTREIGLEEYLIRLETLAEKKCEFRPVEDAGDDDEP